MTVNLFDTILFKYNVWNLISDAIIIAYNQVMVQFMCLKYCI